MKPAKKGYCMNPQARQPDPCIGCECRDAKIKPGMIIRVWATNIDWRIGVVANVAGTLISIDYDCTGSTGYTFDATVHKFEILVPVDMLDVPGLFAKGES